MKLERELYHPLIEGADMENWLLYRIADGSIGKKPFDIGGADAYGIATGIEVKVTAEDPPQASETPLPWEKLFSLHQRWWLNEFADHRCLALVAIYYDRAKEMRLFHLNGQEDDLPRKAYDVGTLSRHEGIYRGWSALGIERVKFGIPRRLRKR